MEDFVKFETAKLAEEKGFTEFSGLILGLDKNRDLCQYPKVTQSLLQKWIWETHKIYINVIWKKEGFDFCIKTEPNRIINECLKLYEKPEQALEAALLYALNLIQC